MSVVLPVYNGQRFVAQAIDSVLAQKDCDLELIVVDDGSTDETPAILERYARNSRVRLVRQANQKLPAALNAGFAHAQGEFYTWTSDDNLMRPRMLSRLVGFLADNQDVEMVYADEELIDENGAPAMGSDFCRPHQSPPGSSVLRRPRDPGELNFVQNNYIGGCFLYRAWAGRVVGDYSGSCFGFEDYDYWMRMNSLFRIAHLATEELLYSYRLHSASLTARDREFGIADRTRYSMPQEAERRRFFSSGFDITFRGRHPWFEPLTRMYRQSGHNVLEEDRTQAFAKSIIISSHDLNDDPKDCFAVVRDNRLSASGVELTAQHPSQMAYPLLALANATLWRQKSQCPGSR